VTDTEDTGPIGPELLRCHRERFTGVLHVDGAPGGTIRLRDGLVIAADTPAAPGPEVLLLRSGRVTEHEWTRAYDTAVPYGRLAAELAERGMVGEAGVEALCLLAIADALFAMTAYGAERVRREPLGPDAVPPPLPLDPGADPHRLVRETARRMRAAAAWTELGVTVRGRPRPAPSPPAGGPPPDPIQRDVLGAVNGRRTPRDIAFAAGRGLYAVLGEIARLVREGFLEPGVPLAAGSPAEGPAGLPRRRRGASMINEMLPRPRTGGTPRLRRLRAIQPVQPPADSEEKNEEEREGGG
jgi:hypothetical protein